MTMMFAFPEPGLIEGKLTIVDVNVTVVIGVNGAGKYTAVNVLVGMQLPLRSPFGSTQALSSVRGSARLPSP